GVNGALAGGQVRLDDGQARRAPPREQRFGQAGDARDDGGGAGRVGAQELQQRRRDEGHVARDADHAGVPGGRDERGVDAGQRAGAAVHVGDDLGPQTLPRRGVVGNDQDARERGAQRLQQPFGDRTAPDDQGGLRLTAQPRGGTSRDDGGHD